MTFGSPIPPRSWDFGERLGRVIGSCYLTIVLIAIGVFSEKHTYQHRLETGVWPAQHFENP